MAKIILRAGKVAIKIILLFAILGFIFYSVKLLTPAKASEDPPTEQEAGLLIEKADAIYQDIETGTYSKKSLYGQAEKIYQAVVTEYPDTEDAFEAQAKLVNLDIVSGRWPQAQAAYQELLADFAGNENMPRAVRDIAYRYHIFKRYNEAVELYQYIINTWPDSFYAMYSQMAVEVSKSGLGNDETAEANINRVLTDFGADERLPETVRDIAYQYHMLEKYDKAIELYQLIRDTWPGSFYAMWSQMGAAMSNVALGDDAAVGANVDRLLADFAGGEYDDAVAKAVRDIAYQYQTHDKYDKAVEIYQLVTDTWPGSFYAMWSQMGAAMSNAALGDDEALVSNIDNLLDYAGGEYDSDVAQAVRDLAYQCNKFGRYERASELYQYILDNYPDSEYVIWSKAGIIQTDIGLGNHATAQTAIDGFIAEFKDHPEFALSLCAILEQYYNGIFLVEGLVDEDWLRPLEVWEKVLAAVPGFSHKDPVLYYFIAGCYGRFGEYETAREYFEFTASEWPDNKMGTDAQFMLKELDELEQAAAMVAE